MFMKRKDIMRALIEKVADRMIFMGNDGFSEECPISIIDINKWEWAQGVGLYGIYKYWKAAGQERYFEFLVQWYKDRIKEGLPEKNVNTCAPILTLTYLYKIVKNEQWLDIIKEWAAWIYNEMPRTEDGGLQHITTGVENKGQLWADTLFMTNLSLARAGVILKKQEYIEESKKQFLIHIKYLFDKKNGLWFHGWSFLRRDNFSEVHWGRGNCWYTFGVADYLDMVELEPTIKEYLLQTYKTQVRALKQNQNENGMWKTIIDDKDSYDETSATAGFCYGILKGVRKGWLEEDYWECAKSAFDAVCKRVADDGTVLEVSYGTPVFEIADEYKEVPFCPMTYGQALAILCMTEWLEVENEK